MKPLFIMFMEIGTGTSVTKVQTRRRELNEYLEKEVGEDFKILIFPTTGQSYVQIHESKSLTL